MEKGTPGKILVWCAIIGAIGTLAAALINGWFQHGNSAQTKPESPAPIVQTEPTTTPFTGIVTREDGTPVVHARVQASLDQQIPQSSLTDADGEFHFEVPRDSKVMHITVYADGYTVFDRDVNAHRTGMEVVVLAKKVEHIAPPTKPKTAPDQTSGAATPTQPNPSIAQPQQTVQPQQNCGPSVTNCNFAPNQGHQDTYYGAPTPPPIASFTRRDLPIIDLYSSDHGAGALSKDPEARHEGRMIANPGVLVSIRVPSDFQYPAFIIDCDSKCGPSAAFLVRYGNSSWMDSPIQYEYGSTAYSSNEFAVKLRVPEGEFGPGESIDLRVRSATKDPVQITAVTSINGR